MAKESPTKPKKRGEAKPPRRYEEFIERFPDLAKAWDSLHEAGAHGPLDARMQRLARLAVAMGASREGAVRSGARKAVAAGLTREELEQLVPLAASTIGLPAAVACWSWILDALKKG
jgi:alkylhydroperoxidase/carboxymuconolactone decarboxylase family protein YurZ